MFFILIKQQAVDHRFKQKRIFDPNIQQCLNGLQVEARVAEGARNCLLNYHKYSPDTQTKRWQKMIKHKMVYLHVLMGEEQE